MPRRDFCEMPFVDAMTRRDRIENHETTFDAAWIADNTDRILWTLEEPPLAMPAFAQYRMFEFCAEHGATVILDGQGADEITGGYPYHQRAFLKDRLLHRQPLAMLVGTAGDRAARAAIGDRGILRFFHPPLHPAAAAVSVDRGWRRRAPAIRILRMRAQRLRARPISLVNRQLYFDVRWGNVKIVLGYGDRNAMAHSIEARVPYFDRAFVELLFSLPDDVQDRQWRPQAGAA